MITITSVEAQNRFGQLLDTAQARANYHHSGADGLSPC